MKWAKSNILLVNYFEYLNQVVFLPDIKGFAVFELPKFFIISYFTCV